MHADTARSTSATFGGVWRIDGPGCRPAARHSFLLVKNEVLGESKTIMQHETIFGVKRRIKMKQYIDKTIEH